MKNLKKLSRNELKDVFGGNVGDPCSLSVQQANGSWITYPGKCAYVMNTTSSNGVTWGGSYYCETGTGNSHAITSNSGVSRCTGKAGLGASTDLS
ncbi:bacteriocin-like protein [Chryseobacterium viscerum]|uniref:Bacteriocin n=1 Tax=Chryseobacterium viscerum TaxID=1037377 RepID=A0A316WML9_9FLAO|nr:hypothetical protein [Chryseobacterium viscerum]KAB1231026.1 hypothetical protein F8D52_08110 [Chryseobacterium viscerum]PWN62487.1 hypothetical protein C1634_006810 [Chryseobacterium viscerum]